MSESMSPPPRELAQRRSGSDEILLLWYPESERVEVTVCDVETGAGFQLEVAPGSAISVPGMNVGSKPVATGATGDAAGAVSSRGSGGASGAGVAASSGATSSFSKTDDA